MGQIKYFCGHEKAQTSWGADPQIINPEKVQSWCPLKNSDHPLFTELPESCLECEHLIEEKDVEKKDESSEFNIGGE